MSTNKIDSPTQLLELTHDCKYMWHLAAVIKPPTDGRVSMFADKQWAKGLKGKLEAYDKLRMAIDKWAKVAVLQAFVECDTTPVECIESQTNLMEYAGLAINALNKVCQANGINGFAGRIENLAPDTTVLN